MKDYVTSNLDIELFSDCTALKCKVLHQNACHLENIARKTAARIDLQGISRFIFRLFITLQFTDMIR